LHGGTVGHPAGPRHRAIGPVRLLEGTDLAAWLLVLGGSAEIVRVRRAYLVIVRGRTTRLPR
jgi:hypothetical protein